MLVKNWMSRNVVTVDADDSMYDAIHALKAYNIRMLPVLRKGRLCGVVTDRDLKRASASDATTLDVYELVYLTSKIAVKHIMSKDVITVPEDFTIDETAEILMKNKISGVPVRDTADGLAGVITQTDLYRALISLAGLRSRGVQFALEVADEPGAVKALTDVLREYSGRMASLLTSTDRAAAGHRRVYLRTYAVDRSRLGALHQALAQKGRLLYVVDHRENRRDIFD